MSDLMSLCVLFCVLSAFSVYLSVYLPSGVLYYFLYYFLYHFLYHFGLVDPLGKTAQLVALFHFLHLPSFPSVSLSYKSKSRETISHSVASGLKP